MTALTRRSLLTATAAWPLAAALSGSLAEAREPPRVLVLVELNGGNDGLNTVIPYGDPAYARARPGLAVASDQVIPLGDHLGLHPALAPLTEPWQAGELMVALGVGYERPNRSHFRSIEIWNSASDAGETLQDGWLHRVIAESGMPRGFAAQGIVLGGPAGPLVGSALSPVVMHDPRQLHEAARLPGGEAADVANPALAHILATRARMQAAARDIARRLRQAPALATRFPDTELGRQLGLAATLIAAGVEASAIKVQQSGYDTHAQQGERHAVLLGDLAGALSAFRAALIEAGAWRRTLLATYSEFGRRVAENASAGSDHGAAAPHFLFGGRLRGGFVGAQPPLDDLERGDLRHRLDFRRLYASLAQDWLGLPPAPAALGRHRPLPLLA